MKINEDETFASPSFKDVVKWLINIVYRFYCKYIELYDFEDIL